MKGLEGEEIAKLLVGVERETEKAIKGKGEGIMWPAGHGALRVKRDGPGDTSVVEETCLWVFSL